MPQVSWRWLVCCIALAAAACGGSVTKSSTRSESTTTARSSRSDDLRRAAKAYARAWLAVDMAAVARSHGPGCGASDPAPPIDNTASLPEIKEMRSLLRRELGVPLGSIKIRDVLVRNLTPTTGEAMVEYNQPVSVTGDDNWVTYELHDGRWTNDCKAPIGSGSRNHVRGSSVPGVVAAP